MGYVAASPALSPKQMVGPAEDWRKLLFPWASQDRRVIGTLNGRTALWLALRHLLPEGGRVVLPAFVCPSVEPPVRAFSDDIVLYDVDDQGEPRVDDIEEALEDGRPAAVIVLHYCGFPNRRWSEIAALAARSGGALIEDCAHAALGYDHEIPLGSLGAASIFSLRKYFPIPDAGALVVGSEDGNVPAPSKVPGVLSTVVGTSYLLASSVEARLGWTPRTRILTFRGVRERLQARETGSSRDGAVEYATGMSWISRVLLSRQRPHEIVKARRANYAYLLDALQGLSWLRPMFPELPDGVCPFAFPALCNRRDEVREHLLCHGINARSYWDVLPQMATPGAFLGAHELARTVLVLPIHQSIDERGLEYTVDVLRKFRP